MELDDLIRYYDYSIPDTVCKNAIRLFEKLDDEDIEDWDRNGRPQFQQFNLTQKLEGSEDLTALEDWGLIHNAFIESAHNYVQKYMDDVDCRQFFPARSTIEQFRIKKYRAGTDDRFDRHVDVGDYESARRFLTLFWYLNDVEEGGETDFGDIAIKPKCGRLLIFPPMWTFPHSGNPTVSNDKYIAGTYCHYV